jgi:DNA mismatch endonuclease, patch repair protein
MDVLTPEQRSFCMSRIRGNGTSPELSLKEACEQLGLEPSQQALLAGKPDLIFPKSNVAVFIDGCFWHGCPAHYSAPSQRQQFWQRKLFANQLRDRSVTEELTEAGWLIIRIWEHDLRNPLSVAMAAHSIWESQQNRLPSH